MPKSFESLDDIKRAFEKAALSFSERKLERWDAEGLLNRRQTHPTGVKGSRTEYAIGTARQALAIARLLKGDRNLDSVGWLLWLEGEEVPERFWRSRFEKVAQARDAKIAELREHFNEDDSPVLRAIEGLTRQDLPPHFRRLIPDGLISNVVGALLSMVSGAYNTQLDENENKAVLSAMGITQNIKQSINGVSLEIDEAMPWVLHRIAEALSASTCLELAQLPACELEKARNDFLAASQIQSGLYEQGTRVLNDKNPFGLKMGVRLSEQSDHDEVAFQILMFANLRRNTDAFVSPEKIHEMAEQIKSQLRKSLDRFV